MYIHECIHIHTSSNVVLTCMHPDLLAETMSRAARLKDRIRAWLSHTPHVLIAASNATSSLTHPWISQPMAAVMVVGKHLFVGRSGVGFPDCYHCRLLSALSSQLSAFNLPHALLPRLPNGHTACLALRCGKLSIAIA
ncbi:hypothetical protein BU24DRAFT_64579 [Aaosphaeria arxii CBS 175.79]|uniref:Uncharacterized protein n=1 Tax=Aaosphaeria arxii CBS 175.79 TaxID=1450172 RepID=A0A6A5XA57_9PLEO|nr:uncharacterized protein BU24DRAFT_64579 [Aaosphaeria arxii CBS 175.79]KAF2009800.1 hypothetical protein BU24DRAFT_64579 [Aaosphaeria arxii CBS 175.79]